MDKLRLDFFDILGYLIPGTALLLSLWITADQSVQTLDDLYAFVQKIETKTLLSGIIVAYIFGFTLHYFGTLVFKRLQTPPRKLPVETLPENWAIIRQYGEKHLVVLDRWQALKALAANLSAFSLISILLSVIKWRLTGQAEWLILAPFFALLFWIYKDRAVVFHTYLDQDAHAVIESLQLREKISAK